MTQYYTRRSHFRRPAPTTAPVSTLPVPDKTRSLPSPLPSIPSGTTPAMADLVNGYRTAYFSHCETAGEEVEAAAGVVQQFPATTLPDLTAKLLVAIHHAHPGHTRDGQLSVDPVAFECTQAGQLMLSTLTDAMRLAETASPITNAAFDAVYATYAACRAEQDRYANGKASDDVFDAAVDRADVAFNIMLDTPVTDPDRAALKLAAGFDRYDIANTGLLRSGPGAVLADAARIVREGAPFRTDPPATVQVADRTEWDRLCTAYHATRRIEDDLLRAQDERQRLWFDIRKQSEPEPKKPDPGPIDQSLPLATIVEQSASPEWKVEWASYEAMRADWKARHDAEREAFFGDVEAQYDAAQEAAREAFWKVREYPVTSLSMLSEKADVFKHRYGENLEGSDALSLIAEIKRLASQEGN